MSEDNTQNNLDRRQAEAEKQYRREHVRQQSEDWKARQRGEKVPSRERAPVSVNSPAQLAREAGEMAKSRMGGGSNGAVSIVFGAIGLGMTVLLLAAAAGLYAVSGGAGWFVPPAVLGIGSVLLLFSGLRKNARGKQIAEELRIEEKPDADGQTLSGQVDEERRKRESELNATVAEGTEYIRKIRNLNDLIPDEHLSEQMDEMEGLLKEIFNALQERIDQLDRTRKLMKYYLPTTVKLLEGYRDFDNVSTPDENISEAKAEIEKTLELINQAYREILNSLFREDALDVTTDAQVLQTMLAKDGLTREMEPAWAQTAEKPQTQQEVMK